MTAVVNLNAVLHPLGGLIAGAGADLLGPEIITAVLAGLAAATAVLVFLSSSTIRNYRLSHAIGEKAEGKTGDSGK